MSALMFAYVHARQLEVELDVKRRHLNEAPSMRDRLGKTLIAWGEQLVTLPPASSGVRASVRPAA